MLSALNIEKTVIQKAAQKELLKVIVLLSSALQFCGFSQIQKKGKGQPHVC